MTKHNANRRICQRCRLVFCAEKEDELYCNYMCKARAEKKTAPGERIKEKNCKKCGKLFEAIEYHGQSSNYCSSVCKKHKPDARKPMPEKIENANKLWMENKNLSARNKGKKVPLDILIKGMEKKRVWENKGWDHYLKGRKWDRI